LLLSAVPNPEGDHAQRRFEGRGEVQTAVDPPPGCRFVARCPNAMEQCMGRTPELTEVEPGHWARCYLYPGA
jgi:oligopeptide/dipeptide ABC transporter ATP-binding protein